MPNWCCQNIILRGKKEDIKNFCDRVNSCLTAPDAAPNDFGKLWLGNVSVAFGYEYDQHNGDLRGLIDADFNAIPCLFGPEKNINPLEYGIDDNGDASVAFSIITAWSLSRWFWNALQALYPKLEYAWKATDEFGNFYLCKNRKMLGLPAYIIYDADKGLEWTFDKGREADVAKKLTEITGMSFTQEEITEEDDNKALYEKIYAYNDGLQDIDESLSGIEYTVWKETN